MRDSVVVIGGGMMGYGIAAIAASAGNPVIVVERKVKQESPERVRSHVEDLLNGGLIEKEQAEKAYGIVSFTDDMKAACEKANFIVEAVVEDLPIKQDLFQKLDEMLPPEVLITSTTSGLLITDIGAKVKHKGRIATAHFWFPAHIIPLVEVVMGDGTTLENAEAVRDVLKSWGKAPVIVRKDTPGQLVNRIFQAILREATNMVEIGLASAEDVDTAIKTGVALRLPVWGPLEHIDGVGIDLCCRTQDSILPAISAKPGASDAMKQMLADGNLGYKTGKGFYDWSKKDMQKLQKLRNDFIIQSIKYIRDYDYEA